MVRRSALSGWLVALVALPLFSMSLAGCPEDDKPPTSEFDPRVVADDQTPDPANVVVVKTVTSPGAGFIVIHEDNAGTWGDVLGETAVSEGDNNNVSVTLDRNIVDGETLYAMLHTDAGEIGVYEPDKDTAVTDANGSVVVDSFVVSGEGSPEITPSVTVDSPMVLEDNVRLVIVREAVSDGPGLIIVHEDNGAGAPGAGIGTAALGSGPNSNVAVTLDRDAVDGETLYAMLHADAAPIGVYENNAVDPPVTDANGDVIAPAFVIEIPEPPPEYGSVSVSDQVAAPANQVLVASVDSVGPGWIVIHEDDGGSPGGVLGQTQVSDGEQSNVSVTLSRDAVDGETLYAMLHIDAGELGTYEFPGPDTPATDENGDVITPSFVVTVSAFPYVVVNDQEPEPLSEVVVAEVFSQGAGFLVVHEDNGAGSWGAAIGNAAVADGLTSDLVVTLDRDIVDGETLYAMLHTDATDDGGAYDPDNDTPVTGEDGQIVTPSFVVTVPGEDLYGSVTVSTQVLAPKDEVVVANVFSVGPGWMVIHADDGGAPGEVLGQTAVSDGSNDDVVVTLSREGVHGETLYAMLHVDLGEEGTYEFPGEDVPALDAEGNVISPAFVVAVEPFSAEVVVADQTPFPLDEVLIDMVVAKQPGWLVIHEDDAGSVGPIIGLEPVPAGFTYGLVIPLDRDVVDGETLYAMLHINTGELDTYEPDVDVPVEVAGEILAPPFVVTVGDPPEPSVTVSDQLADPLDQVVIDEVTYAEQGFVVIHEEDAGSFGAVIGWAAIDAGTTADVVVVLDRDIVDGETLYAMLHDDTDEDGVYTDAATDPPVVDGDGMVVTPTFVVTAPAPEPYVIVSDQVADPLNEVVVDEALSVGLGFMVIHEDDGGSFGAVIGNAALSDGVNSDIVVTLDRDIVDGETLWAMLHIDTDGDGVYTDAAADPPVFDGDGNVVAPTFVVSTPATDPYVIVSDQVADPLNEVVIDEALSVGLGFMVIHEDDGGSFGAVIGNAALSDGINSNVVVTLDRDIVDGETLWAMLHIDTDGDGVYTDAAADPPVFDGDGNVVAPTFVVSAPGTDPYVIVSDQVADPLNQVVIDEALSVGLGFMVIHEDDGGSFGAVIGNAALSDGVNTNVVVTLDRDIVDGETLWAMLHIDTDGDGVYTDAAADPPVFDGDGNVVAPTFVVTAPIVGPEPSVTVNDQIPEILDEVVVAEVVSVGMGFMVIHEEAAGGGSFGDVIGWAPVADGTSTDVTVVLDREIVDGETLYAMLHTDSDGDMTYTDAAADPPVFDGGGAVIAPTFVVTAQSVTVSDQTAAPLNQVVVDEVVSAGDGFIVIHEEDGGSFGAVIGNAAVSDGSNVDVVVTLDRDIVDGETLYAMLHDDPEGDGVYTDAATDPPVFSGGAPISPSFVVSAPATGTSFAEVNAIFAVKCATCHTTGASGGHSMGSSDVAGTAYPNSQLSSYYSSGNTKGFAALVRIQDGSMPLGAGCTGDPVADAANPACLTQAEQDTIQAWIDDGQLP